MSILGSGKLRVRELMVPPKFGCTLRVLIGTPGTLSLLLRGGKFLKMKGTRNWIVNRKCALCSS
jgi:hypothetical protein